MERNDVVRSVVDWNRRFPLDRWWRNKHGVSFMSPAHRESSFLCQLFEFEEDKMFFELGEELAGRKKKSTDTYVPGMGDIFKAPATMKDFMAEADRELEALGDLDLGDDNG